MSQRKYRQNPKKPKVQKRNWGPYLLGLGLVLLAGLAFFVLRKDAPPKAEIEVTGAPSLKVDQEKIDLGVMKFNQPAEASFQLTNVGDQTLRFSEDPYIEIAEGC